MDLGRQSNSQQCVECFCALLMKRVEEAAVGIYHLMDSAGWLSRPAQDHSGQNIWG